MATTATEPPTAAPAIVPVLGALDRESLGEGGLVWLLKGLDELKELLRDAESNVSNPLQS